MPLMLDRRIFTQFDWLLFALLLILPCISLIVLYSAGYSAEIEGVNFLGINIKSQVFLKQVFFYFIGFSCLFVALFFNPQTLDRLAYFFYGFSIFLLFLVFILGVSANGSQRWLNILGFRFQPSEFMKIAIILCMARYCSKNPPGPDGYSLANLMIPACLIGLPFLLVLAQPDLGTALAVGVIGFSIVLFTGINIKTLLLLGTSGLASFFPAWLWLLKPYQKRRILTLLNPEADPFGSGYHIIQSKIAVGSGSFFGKGYLKGTQTQLEFLPEHTTDFIFSVLAEEWGFLGSAVVIFLYFSIIQRMLSVAQKSRDSFSMLFTVGAAVMLFFHVLVNVGMVLGLMPVVGLPLPLFSYGGTAVVVNFVVFGLILGIGMRRFMFKGFDKLVLALVLMLGAGNILQAETPPVEETMPKEDLPQESLPKAALPKDDSAQEMPAQKTPGQEALAKETPAAMVEAKAEKYAAKDKYAMKIDPAYYSNLLEAVLKQKRFYAPNLRTETQTDNIGAPWHEWLRNDFRIDLGLDDINLNFEFEKDFKDFKAKYSPKIGVKFETSNFVLEREVFRRASKDLDETKNEEYLNYQIKTSKKTNRIMSQAKQQLHIFIPYKNDFGFVLFVPQAGAIEGEDDLNLARGFLMCPRLRSNAHVVAGLPAFINVPIKLKTVHSTASALIKAKVTTGFDQGRALAEIYTSEYLPSSRNKRDESTNLFPFVQLKYVASDFDPKVDNFRDPSVVGIKANMELQNSLNHLVKTSVELGVGVKKIRLPEEQPIRLNKKQYVVEKGDCYALVLATKAVHEFKKQKLAFAEDGGKLEDLVEGLGK